MMNGLKSYLAKDAPQKSEEGKYDLLRYNEK